MVSNKSISSLALVSDGAVLAEDVRVDPFAIVEDNVEIGPGTHVHSGAIIRSGARIGSQCEIHPYAVVAGVPQDLKFRGEETVAIIGDRTVIREYVTVSRGTASRGKTVIGEDCLIMAYAHVAHDCVLRDHVIIGNASQIAGEVEIDDWAILSGSVLVHQFTLIGRHTMTQGGSKVTKDIPPYAIAAREPLVFSGVNLIGLRRRGFSEEEIALVSDAYRILYAQGLNVSDALETIENTLEDTPERRRIVDFIRSSKRGILRGKEV